MRVVAGVLALVLVSFSVAANESSALGNSADGQAKSASCAACHGAKDKAANPIYPNLAGQNGDYLALSLHAYKKGERSGGQAGVMQAFTASLPDQDINDLAAYCASLTPLK